MKLIRQAIKNYLAALQRRLEPFYPLLYSRLDPVTTDPEFFRRVTSLNASLLVGVASCFFMSFFYLLIALKLAIIHWVSTVVFAGMFMAMRYLPNPIMFSRLACLYLMIFLVVVIWQLGGLQSFALAYLIILPITAALVVGLTDAWIWVATSIAVTFGFFITNIFGINSPGFVEPQNRDAVHVVLYTTFAIIIGGLISTWLTRHRALEQRLQDSLRETELEALNASVLAETATAANEGVAFDAAAEGCLRMLCETLSWDVANIWICDDNGFVYPSGVTTFDECTDYEAMRAFADDVETPIDTVIPHLVAVSGLEQLISSFDGDAREGIAKSIGIRTALEWPVVIEGKVDVVLEFFSRKSIQLDDRSLQLMNHVALQLSHVRGRERSRGRIEQLAYYDVVTGLPNRHAFEQRFRAILDSAARRNRRIALMFIDLDGFKRVNDSLGHDAGDQLLHHIGEQLTLNLRTSDLAMKFSGDSKTMVARLGGDEFTVILQDLNDLHGAEVVARRFIDIVSRPLAIGDQQAIVSASIGIAIFPDDATQPADLLRLADAAMYEAKRNTGGQFRFATEALNENVRRRSELETALRTAIDREEIAVHYQPIVATEDHSIIAFEALARWDHAGSEVSPSEFIPLAEDIGLINRLGQLVLKQACKIAALKNNEHDAVLRICVNVSAYQLRDAEFFDAVVSTIREANCLPQWIVLELTESSLISDDTAAIGMLERIHALGIGIALDDFGTGYASLSYLRRFPLTYVKIDRSFIQGVDQIIEDNAIVRAIITMAHTLGLRVIAEGIENENQASRLQELGCDSLQGTWIGAPMKFPEIPTTVVENELR